MSDGANDRNGKNGSARAHASGGSAPDSAARASATVETELKYSVDAATAERYLSSGALGSFRPAGAVRSSQVEDRYVDARDWAITRAGFAARLRRTPRGTRINLKTHGTSGGRRDPLHRREELEGPARATHAPSEWPASPARSVVLELCGDAPLLELLTIRQVRRVRPLIAGETRAELSADVVEIIADGRLLERFDELEIELRGQDEGPLRDLAAELAHDEALRPATTSKFDRAVRAVLAALPTMRDDVQARWLSAPRSLLRAAESAGKSGGGKRKAAMLEAPEDWSTVGAAREARMEAPAEPAAIEPAEPKAIEPKAAEPNEAVATEPAEPDPAESEPAEPAAEAAEPDEPAAEADTDTEKPKRRASRGPSVARSPGVLPDDPLQEAGRKVLRFNFAKMLAKEHGTRSGKDPEDLHDMRVATRRMRAAFRIFADAYRPERTRRMRRRLRSVASRLGTVRDLDVLLEGAAAYRAGLPEAEAAGLKPLIEVWRLQRETERQLLMEELDGDGYRRFVEEMDVFVTAAGAAAAAVATPTAPHRVRDRAPSRIWDAYEQVRAFEPVLPWADVETLHDLRIAGKWLRYTLEFFQEALGQDAPLLVARVTAMQDYLGELHDADVAAKLARDMLLAHSGELTPGETSAIGAYLRARERELAKRKRGVQSVWRAVTGATFRRALGRATAAL